MKLAVWMDAKSRAARTVPQALSLLRAMPGGPNIQIPFRCDPSLKVKIHEAISNEDLNRLIDAAPIKVIPLSTIVGVTQHTVNAARVAQHLLDFGLVGKGETHPEHGGIVDVPIVIRFEDQNCCWDGHHRSTAEALLGGRRIKARYIDLDTWLRSGRSK
jgi:hypothetical protein